MDPTVTITASEARKKLYSLIKEVSKGLKTYEIRLRGANPVLVVNKDEIESWLETLDILSNKRLLKDLRESLADKKKGRITSFEKLQKELGLK